jgi:predicted aspartyl protease
MIPIFINQTPVRALVDTGADLTIISGKFFRKISKGTKTVKRIGQKIFTADASPLNVDAVVETEIKINGLRIPFSVNVIEKLNFDAILGLDFLQQTQAIVDVAENSLTLYQGLLTIPMIRLTDAPSVLTVANVIIPALSEAVFPVKADRKLRKGNYIIEGETQMPRRDLMIALTSRPVKKINDMSRNEHNRQAR